MYPVTDAYNEEMEKSVRNRSWIKIDFGVTDPDAPGASTLSDNGHLSYSNTQGTVIGATSTSYATLEHNRWILDGKNPIPVTDNPIYQGYVGNEISDSTGVWATQPQITCVFDDYFEFAGLSFYFDMSMEDYPSEFKIQAYHDNSEVYNVTDHPTDAYWIHDEQIPICNKIVLTWVKSVRPYRRARMSSFVFGVGMTLREVDIESCSVDKEFDLLSTKFPKNNFDFTIFDTSKRYDPENPAGVWEYLESRQGVDVSVGYSLDDGTIEWIPWTHAYTSGDFSVSGSDVVTLVTIKCVGLIEHLTQRYDTSQYHPEGRSLYDLAYDVINDIGFANVIEVDTALRDIKTRVPLPSGQANEVLQLIANAGRCVMNHTRGGVLQIMRDTASEPTFELDFSKMLEKPSTSKTAPLRDLHTLYHPVSVSQERNDIVTNQEVEVIGGEPIYTLTNIIHDGSFESDGQNAYVGAGNNITLQSSTATALYGTHSLYISFSGGTGYHYCDAEYVAKPNHVYYTSWWTVAPGLDAPSGQNYDIYPELAIVESTRTQAIQYVSSAHLCGRGGETISPSNLNIWQHYRGRFTTVQEAAFFKCRNAVANTGITAASIYVDGFLLVDLTDSFGVGNEPSQEWCDEHLDYFDGTIKITKDSYVIHNIMRDPFLQSYTFEQLYPGKAQIANYEIGANGYKGHKYIALNPITTSQEGYIESSFVLPAQSNHKYYVSLMYRNRGGYARCQIYFPYMSPYPNIMYYPQSAGEWVRVSDVLSHATTFSSKFRFDCDNFGENCVSDYSDFIVIDLTKTFGVGNEPTKEWCDAHFECFDGTMVFTPETAMESVVFSHEAAVNQIVTVSEGLFMGTPTYYAYKTVVPLLGSGKVTISANKLDFADIEYTKRYRDVGEDLTTMQNELIDNYEDCADYADWVANVVQRRNYYKVSDRGYPQLDLGDKLTFTSNFLNEIVATVTKQKISFNGAITGEGEYTIGGDE